MAYEVFIPSRMREDYDRNGSPAAAVIRGIGRTGRLVTSAALILFVAFTNWWLPRWPARLLRVEPSLPTRAVPGKAEA